MGALDVPPSLKVAESTKKLASVTVTGDLASIRNVRVAILKSFPPGVPAIGVKLTRVTLTAGAGVCCCGPGFAGERMTRGPPVRAGVADATTLETPMGTPIGCAVWTIRRW